MSAGTAKRKAPEQPEIQTAPEQSTPEVAAPPSDKTTSAALEKTVPPPAKSTPPPVKSTTPAKTPAPAPPKITPPPQPQVAKTKVTKVTKVAKGKDTAPSSSTTIALHTGKGVGQISSLVNPELEGHVPL
jgi:hypothetical protein